MNELLLNIQFPAGKNAIWTSYKPTIVTSITGNFQAPILYQRPSNSYILMIPTFKDLAVNFKDEIDVTIHKIETAKELLRKNSTCKLWLFILA